MKQVFTMLLILSLSYSCRESFEISNLNNNQITILGHGGMGIEHTYPLNSFESISKCLSLDSDGTEIDVQMTKDSVLIAFHDERLEHSTDEDGPVFEKTWDEIKNAKYKYPLYAGYKLVKLDDVFSNIQNPKDFIFFLDCKSFSPDTTLQFTNQFMNAILQLIDDHDLQSSVVVELKRNRFISSMKSKRPDLTIFTSNEFEEAFELAKKYQLQGITMAIDRVSKSQVEAAHLEDVLVAVFNTHSKKRNIDAIEKNVDFILTDKLKHLIRVLK